MDSQLVVEHADSSDRIVIDVSDESRPRVELSIRCGVAPQRSAILRFIHTSTIVRRTSEDRQGIDR